MRSVPQRPGEPGQALRPGDDERFVTLAAYAMLFLLGIGEGLIGSFHYSGSLGPVPAAAIGFDLLLLATCLAGAWGMSRPAGGLMPAVGWLVASFVLAMGTPGGSVLITNTTAGKWYLYGGSVCAAAGAVAAFSGWSRRPGRRP